MLLPFHLVQRKFKANKIYSAFTQGARKETGNVSTSTFNNWQYFGSSFAVPQMVSGTHMSLHIAVHYSRLCSHTVRPSASSFSFQYPLFSLRPSSSWLRHLPRLPTPFVFHSIACFRRQFLRNMWPIQLAFLLFIVCRMSLSSLTLCNTSSFLTRSVQLIFSILLQRHIPNFPVSLIYFPKCPSKAVLRTVVGKHVYIISTWHRNYAQDNIKPMPQYLEVYCMYSCNLNSVF
jgi:hypothetical protein